MPRNACQYELEVIFLFLLNQYDSPKTTEVKISKKLFRVRNIHRHASQRLLSLLVILIKKQEAGSEDSKFSAMKKEQMKLNLDTHMEIIQTLLEIINSCLVNNLGKYKFISVNLKCFGVSSNTENF